MRAAGFALVLLSATALAQLREDPNRFVPTAVFPNLKWAKLDRTAASFGIANGLARERGAQARILWIDGTANMERVDTEEKVSALMEKVARTGFNTIVYDVKPIVGRTMYPSKLTGQMTSWRGQTMPEGYDPVAHIVRYAKANSLGIYLSMNAFSEGHSFARRAENDPSQGLGDPGYGYRHPDQQSVLMVSSPALAGPGWGDPLPVQATVDPSGLEAARDMPSEAQIGIYTRIPNAVKETCACLVLNAEGRVVQTVVGLPTSLPQGSLLVVGLGESGAELLRSLPGDRVRAVARTKLVPAAEAQDQIPLMMNPHHPQVQSRALEFVREAMGRYAVNGFVYDDRLRFANISADFSPQARSAFQAWVGKPVRWPEDVYTPTYSLRLTTGVRPGRYYDAWLAFRAKTMADWVRRVGRTVRETRKGAQFAVYAGSNFGDYANFGTNYGSSQTNAGYPFLTGPYREQGFASELDFLMTGCYYRYGTIFEAMESGMKPGFTVEAAGLVSNRVVRDQTWTYASIMLSLMWDNPDNLDTVLQAACATTQGVMVFDLSHQIDRFWPTLERAFSKPAVVPHLVPGLTATLRNRRARADSAGAKDPPFPIFEGMAGAGF
ncbi:MAG: alpha amylase family protein [Fimbriimonadaceae bacterium]